MNEWTIEIRDKFEKILKIQTYRNHSATWSIMFVCMCNRIDLSTLSLWSKIDSRVDFYESMSRRSVCGFIEDKMESIWMELSDVFVAL